MSVIVGTFIDNLNYALRNSSEKLADDTEKLFWLNKTLRQLTRVLISLDSDWVETTVRTTLDTYANSLAFPTRCHSIKDPIYVGTSTNIVTKKSLEWIRARRRELGAGNIASQGTITLSGLSVADQTFVIDDHTFIWKAARAATGQVTIGGTAAASVTNIVTAVNADLTTVTAADGTGDTVVLTAVERGEAGDLITLTKGDSANMAVDAATFGTTTAGVSSDLGQPEHYAVHGSTIEFDYKADDDYEITIYYNEKLADKIANGVSSITVAAWATGQNYTTAAPYLYSDGVGYIIKKTHTSTTIAADLLAGNIEVYAPITMPYNDEFNDVLEQAATIFIKNVNDWDTSVDGAVYNFLWKAASVDLVKRMFVPKRRRLDF